MRTFGVTIEGISPLLMHRFPEEGADSTIKKRTGAPDWKEEAERSLYKTEDGTIYQPASHIEGTVKEAAKQFKITGRRGATYSKLVGSTVEVYPDYLVHKKDSYVIDSRPVRIQAARIIRYRPKFEDWALDFDLILHDEQVPSEVVKQILDHAGLYVGIGDFRPGKGGKYGKFMITRFEEQKDKV